MTSSTLVVTMGGQAQVVTFALDWLLAQGERVDQVIVLHLRPKDARSERALQQITAEFNTDHYQGRLCRLRLYAIRDSHQKLADIQNEADAEATWQTVYRLLRSLKLQGQTLHLCIAGGRRMMGLLTLSAAMLLCGHQDRIWHMYTPADFLERAKNGAIMHAAPEAGVRLIQVPVMPWGAYVPALRDLAQPAANIIAEKTAWLDETEQARCRAVEARLTDRQRDVLRLLAAGCDPQTVAEQLSITLTTVNSHKTAILAECRVTWNLPEDSWLTYHFIREKFEHHPL
ncbi:MAG: histidine kinase [Anaerolineae bacterium]|nr:histidine kinase [Anaerolineae bacterium]